MRAVSSNVRRVLQKAGWFEGRAVPVDPDVPPSHPAYALLAEMGGLCIVVEDMVAIDFRYAAETDALIEGWSVALASRMVAIAGVHNDHATLYMTEGGHVIGSSFIHDACWFEGRTIETAVSNILAGVRSGPMLLPGQAGIYLYGEIFRQGDDGVIGPESSELH